MKAKFCKVASINRFLSALKEYEEAAEDFMGEVEFYAVVNSYVSYFQKSNTKTFWVL